jgi:hypothetical protein
VDPYFNRRKIALLKIGGNSLPITFPLANLTDCSLQREGNKDVLDC